MHDPTTRPGEGAKYRFGFALTTAAGNMTRYLNLRKYAVRDADVECVWAPVKHFLDPDPFRLLPGPVRARAVVMRECSPVLRQMGRLDAVMYHVFEAYVASVARSIAFRFPLLVWSADNPPHSSKANSPRYASNERSEWRRKLHYRLDLLCIKRTALFFPWSTWAADVLIDRCAAPREKVYPFHVGLDLEDWQYRPKTSVSEQKPRILFVGGDFIRKGGDILLDSFGRHFSSVAELHLVTKDPPGQLPPNVFVHTSLSPNDGSLMKLYDDADLFVLPTRADFSSYASLEAMATGRPVIATTTGGVTEIVRDGKTGFLIQPDDQAALVDRMNTLLRDYALRREMGAEGRKVVEQHYNAAVSVPRILGVMKAAVDAARLKAGAHPRAG